MYTVNNVPWQILSVFFLIIIFIASSLVIGKTAMKLYRKCVPLNEDSEETLALVHEEQSDNRFLTMFVGWLLTAPLFWCMYKLIMLFKVSM